MRVLLTGFEPFDGEAINPSWEAARALDGWHCGNDEIVARRMPCAFGAALRELDAAMDEVRPRLVVGVGQAGGRAEISPERVAINVDDGRIRDNAGLQPIDTPVIVGAPAAYFSSLPIKAITRDLRAAGIPAAVSNTAGTFVCNHLFFGLMHRIALRPADAVRGGFIHIPFLPEQALRHPGDPSMPLATVIEALRIAIATSLRVRHDVPEAGGRLH